MSSSTEKEPEAASESPKNKGGRPPAHDAELMATYGAQGLFGDIHSRKGKVDWCYRIHAVNVLTPPDDSGERHSLFPWLADVKAMDKGEPNAWQPSILTELGRFKDDGLIREYARQLSEVRNQAEPESPLTSKEAVAMLRQARLPNKKAQS